MVHGFTQTHACWHPFDVHLDDNELVLIDAPGHGASPDGTLDLVDTADALAETGDRGSYLGYSMGGRMALHVALRHPGLVERLILISATAGIDDPAGRAQRRHADEALAERIEQIGVTAFVDEWLALPLFTDLSPAVAHRSIRLTNRAAGLAESLRHAGTGTMEPLWGHLGELDMPVLVVVGANDAKFAETGGRMVDTIGPNAELAVIDGAGHTVHLEAPTETAHVVSRWLEAGRARSAEGS